MQASKGVAELWFSGHVTAQVLGLGHCAVPCSAVLLCYRRAQTYQTIAMLSYASDLPELAFDEIIALLPSSCYPTLREVCKAWRQKIDAQIRELAPYRADPAFWSKLPNLQRLDLGCMQHSVVNAQQFQLSQVCRLTGACLTLHEAGHGLHAGQLAASDLPRGREQGQGPAGGRQAAQDLPPGTELLLQPATRLNLTG